ncbi:MAG: AI-2E family transporter [Chloroflexi bacterium]|nr:AI-2E family transporter [Chloroflexota bacterium]
MNRERVFRIALILGVFVLGIVIVERLWALGQTLAGVLSTLAGAWFLAFAAHPFIVMLNRALFPVPLMKWVERRYGAAAARGLARWHLPYGIAVLVVYVIMIVIVVGLATIIVAAIIPQATDLIAKLPEISSRLPSMIVEAWATIAQRFGFNPNAITSVVSAQEISSRIAQLAGSVAQQALLIVTGTATLIGQFFLMLVLSLYIVTEGKLIERQFFALLPGAWHNFIHVLLDAVNRAFGGYLRGNVFSAVVRGIFTVALFSLFGVNFGIVLALVYALLSLIPLIGSPVAILIAAIVTLVVRPDAVLPVVIILFVFDQIVAYVIIPRIMSDSVGVPGLIGLISISIGVQLFGFWGLVFSVPAMGAVYTILFEYYLPRRRRAEGLPESDPELEKFLGVKHRKPTPAPKAPAVSSSPQTLSRP